MGAEVVTEAVDSDQIPSNGSEGSKVEEWKPTLQFWLALAPLTVLAMMVSLDGTSVSVALPIIAKALHGSAIEAFWTGTSFLLTSSVFQLPVGALSEIFGRMYTLSVCIVFFLVGIIVSSVSHDFTTMLVGRALQGVGGGGLILLNDIVITDLVPMRQRGAYFGILGGIWAVGTVTGPVVGGAFAYKASWRWLFWINIPFAVVGLIMVPLFLRLKPTAGSIPDKLAKIDWVGSILFVAGATSFLMPLTWGGVQFAWTSWRTLLPLFLGVAGMVAFAIYEMLVPKQPIMRTDLFRDYNLSFSLFGAVIHSAVVYAALYFLPLYFEAVKDFNPILAGVALFPASFTVAPFSIVAGITITKTGSFRPVVWLGWIITTIGLGVMILLDVNTSVAQWFFITFTTGIGLGFLYTSLAIMNQAAAPSDKLNSLVISLFIFARCLGQCLGVAMGGSIFQNQMRHNLANTATLADKAEEYSRDASGIVAALRQMPASQSKTELIQAYSDSLKIVWVVFCALCGVCTLASVFIKHVSLDREHGTTQGLHQDSEENTEKSEGEM